jgi:hypothetical protein
MGRRASETSGIDNRGASNYRCRTMKNLWILFVCVVLACPFSLQAATLQAGPTRKYKTPCAAIAAAHDGDVVRIDSGTYTGDVCAFQQNDLTVRGVSATNRPVINANHTAAEKLGTWVSRGRNFTVENVEMEGSWKPQSIGGNGAALRELGKNWTVRNCYLHDNQNGILEGNVVGSKILIEYSEFARNGVAHGESSGYTHNLYVGTAGELTFRFNYSHDAIVGHLLKTRAAVNYILYNRLSGQNGTDSYEADIPEGGTTYFIGNIVQQGKNSQNPAMLSYMEEGWRRQYNPGGDLYVIDNTFVNQLGRPAPFINVGKDDTTPVVVQNNILYGGGKVITQKNAKLISNFSDDPKFVNVNGFDYRLRPGSPAIGAATHPGSSPEGYSLVPADQYVQPACGETRQNAKDIGALAYRNKGSGLNCRP